MNSFVIESEVFCHQSATVLLNLSKYMVGQVVKEHSQGYFNSHHGNNGNFYRSPKRDKAIAFILQFAEKHCENLPDKQEMRLPAYISVKEVFGNYVEQVPAYLQLKVREFYKIFKLYFKDVARPPLGLPRVKMMPRNTHPVCNECNQVNILKKTAKNESERIYAVERKRQHMLEIKQKYIQFCERKELSVQFPEDYIHINMDDIDQEKMRSPHNLQRTKDSSGMLKLENHCTGVIATNGKLAGDRKIFMFLNNNQFPQDSNKTVSILFNVLLTLKKDLGGKLPRKLFIQSDNCGRDLKNQNVLAFYWILVDLDIFEEIIVSHLDVGHTHGEVDQIFSIIATRLQKIEMPTFETLISELKRTQINGHFMVVEELTHTTDFVGHMLQYLQPINGHTNFFQFKIRKESSVTKMFLKQDVLDLDWQFPNGVWLLRQCPSMKNLRPSPFRSNIEYTDILKSVSRKYFPMLSLKCSAQEMDEIKKTWHDRITWLSNVHGMSFEAFDIFLLRPEQLSLQSLRRPILKERNNACLTATFYENVLEDITIENLKKDCSLVFYTRDKSSRPWIGLFVELLQCNDDGTQNIKIEWLKKDKKLYVLDQDHDGRPSSSVQNLDSVMFMNVLTNTSTSRSGPYNIDLKTRKEIRDAYIERDKNLS